MRRPHRNKKNVCLPFDAKHIQNFGQQLQHVFPTLLNVSSLRSSVHCVEPDDEGTLSKSNPPPTESDYQSERERELHSCVAKFVRFESQNRQPTRSPLCLLPSSVGCVNSLHKARNLMDPACGAGPQYVTPSSPLDRRRPGRPVAIHAQFTPSRIDREATRHRTQVKCMNKANKILRVFHHRIRDFS